jgi:hypothetical protein
MEQPPDGPLKWWMRAASAPAAALFRLYWSLLWGILRHTLQVLLALVVLFEEWGWRPLAVALAEFARWRPWARAEAVIASLPPYLALAAFALPTSLFLPLKLVAVYLIANGHLLTASALFVLAKIVGTALIARIFQLTQPALMQIGWFAAGYARFVPWKEALFAYIRASWIWRSTHRLKADVVEAITPAWRGLRARMDILLRDTWQRARMLFERLR